ncbi:hypothetical protein [Geotoga petraea]|uniref:hypothetical protein n=1 Tax=Geotoga petraea TaxID=28234 RepID=UPI00159F8C1D|nr:hypothetical protein [Geotoga petraea]
MPKLPCDRNHEMISVVGIGIALQFQLLVVEIFLSEKSLLVWELFHNSCCCLLIVVNCL